jgi:hypothetical protein
MIDYKLESKKECNYLVNSNKKVIGFIMFLISAGKPIRDAASICYNKHIKGEKFGRCQCYINYYDFIEACEHRFGEPEGDVVKEDNKEEEKNEDDEYIEIN